VEQLHREHREEVEHLNEEHAEKVASLENDRDARIAAIEARLARELAEAEAQKQALSAAHDEKVADLDVEIDGLKGQIATAQARIADLEGQLAAMTDARNALDRSLAEARDRITGLEADISMLKGDLSDTRKKLDAETNKAKRAFAKWDSDKASLERVKDALAVALQQIEDAENRPIAD